jgi:uncharacterized membrane protein
MSDIRLEWRRQFASSRQVRVAVFLALAALSCLFAVFLWVFVGAWVVLPFAGLEICCVGAAFWWLEQAADDCDRVEISESGVLVLSYRRHRLRQIEFSRGWLSTDLCNGEGGSKSGLRMRQSGRSCELLEFLSVPEQHRALRELRLALASR